MRSRLRYRVIVLDAYEFVFPWASRRNVTNSDDLTPYDLGCRSIAAAARLTTYSLPPPHSPLLSPSPSPPRRTHSTLANISRTVIRSQVSFRITKSVSRENFSIIAKYGNINMSSTSRIRNALSLESFLSNLIKHIYIYLFYRKILSLDNESNF